MGRMMGLELTTFGTTNRRSNQLSYIRHRGNALLLPKSFIKVKHFFHKITKFFVRKTSNQSLPSND